jgi:hypothetical protein
MNYFVSIENSYQHSWQIELLIQSFKDRSAEDNLHIAVGIDDSMSLYDCKNLSNHNNKFYFKKTHPNSSFNKWHSLLKTMEDKKEIFPITVLNPHNIFCSDISINDKKIISSEDSLFTHSLISDYYSEEDEIKKNWIKFGNTIAFNDLPISFFEDILSYIKYFLDKKEFLGIDRAALNLSVWKNWDALFFKDEEASNVEIRPYSIESNMMGNVVKNIINYDHGIQPSFNKIWFSKNDFSMHPDKPIVCLSKIRHTRCADFIAGVAKNYLDENF